MEKVENGVVRSPAKTPTKKKNVSLDPPMVPIRQRFAFDKRLFVLHSSHKYNYKLSYLTRGSVTCTLNLISGSLLATPIVAGVVV